MTEFSSGRRWWPLVAICLGTFMLLVDVTIVGVALPQMSRDLHTQLSSLQWVVDAYALALAALLLLSGSLADRFGRRRLFQAGLLLFAAASLASALAPDAGLLIAARAVQGTGAAAMFATNTALLNATYEGRDRAVAFGIWGAINGAAAAIAPVLGGVLIAAAGCVCWPSPAATAAPSTGPGPRSSRCARPRPRSPAVMRRQAAAGAPPGETRRARTRRGIRHQWHGLRSSSPG